MDVGVVAGMARCALEPEPSFRVVLGHRPDHAELDVRDRPFHEPVGVDYAERVLPRIESTDLRHDGPVPVKVEPGEDRGSHRVAGLPVLWAQRVAGGGGDDELLKTASGRPIAPCPEY